MPSASGTPVKVTPIHMPRHSNSLRRYFLHMYQVSTCGKHERGGSGSDIDSSRWYENVRKSTSPRFGLPSPSLSHTQRGCIYCTLRTRIPCLLHNSARLPARPLFGVPPIPTLHTYTECIRVQLLGSWKPTTNRPTTATYPPCCSRRFRTEVEHAVISTIGWIPSIVGLSP